MLMTVSCGALIVLVGSDDISVSVGAAESARSAEDNL